MLINLYSLFFYIAVKIFLDAKAKEKIKVFGDNYKQALFEQIICENLPTFFEGSRECPRGAIY